MSSSQIHGAGGPPPVSGPPYLPKVAVLGGVPTPHVDDPIAAVLLVFFITSAATNMTIFQINKRRGHKFVLSGLLFGFSMARITANVMRIVWASNNNNVNIAIATQVFTNAGVILLFVVNLIFSQRVLRAFHPSIGWGRPGTWLWRYLYVSVGCSFVMLIISVVYSFFTLDMKALGMVHKVQLFASTYLAVLAFLPLPTIAFCLLWPRREAIESFGSGTMRTKVILLGGTATLLSLGAFFRAGASFVKRPITDPGWIHGKPAFYCFDFLIEIIVVYSYTISRFDRRFHIPDGSSGPGDYTGTRHVDSSPVEPVPMERVPSPVANGDGRGALSETEIGSNWESNYKGSETA